MTIILDGKSLSIKILDELQAKVSKLDRKPHLVVVLVGDDPASHLYVNMKEKMAANLGMKSTILRYPQDTSETIILDKINSLNFDKDVDAILVQLPLPEQISEQKVIQTISPMKDADGITPENIGKISIGVKPNAYPCTPFGILKILEEYGVSLEGKHAVIIGRSNIVGKPLAQMLLNRNATVTICHSKTKNLSEITKTADILISAVGKHKLITKDMVSPNCIIIDVGTSKLNNKSVGDVDFEAIKNYVTGITPVPGGVGPMTIASLMYNTYELSELNRNT